MKKKAQEKGWHLRLQLANSCLLLTQNVVGGCQVRPLSLLLPLLGLGTGGSLLPRTHREGKGVRSG